jgi:hypothetical protein
VDIGIFVDIESDRYPGWFFYFKENVNNEMEKVKKGSKFIILSLFYLFLFSDISILFLQITPFYGLDKFGPSKWIHQSKRSRTIPVLDLHDLSLLEVPQVFIA